jgi:hypothetical protein
VTTALRLVVCVRFRPPADPDADVSAEQAWSQLLRPLAERATALGGRIVGWQPGGISVDFAVDGLQDAVDFLLDEPLSPELSCGLTHGELATLTGGSRMALCTGAALVTAAQLAEFARPGEVLVAPELVEATGGELCTVGAPKSSRAGREPVPALILDLANPLRSLIEPSSESAVADSAPADSAVPTPLVAPITMSSRDQMAEPSDEAITAPAHPAPDPSEPEILEISELEHEAPEPFGLEDQASASAAPSQPSQPPPSLRSDEVERFRQAATAVHVETDSIFPANVADALRRRDASSLDRMAETYRERHQDALASRLDAMASLVRGESAEALRSLRAGQQRSLDASSSEQCRARLALAVGLSAAGRSREAFVEALHALARAREGRDQRGERACARFLAQLSRGFEEPAAAATWDSLCS